MEENMQKCGHENMCYNCQNHSNKCGGKYHHQYGILRWVLFIIVACMIFSLGMRIGEFKGMVENQFGGRGGYKTMHYGSGMMYGSQGFNISAPTAVQEAVPAVMIRR